MLPLNSINFSISNGANYLFYAVLPEALKNSPSIGLVAASCIFSSAVQAAKPQIMEAAKDWSSENRFLLKKSIDAIPFVLVALSLYSCGATLLPSLGRALVLDAVHRKILPDLLDKKTYIKISVGALMSYTCARLVGMLSTIQNLFHLSIYCLCRGIGAIKKRPLTHLVKSIQGANRTQLNQHEIQENLNLLPRALRDEVYRQVYILAGSPQTGEGNWGEIHVTDDWGRLETALCRVLQMPYTFYWEHALWTQSHQYTLEGRDSPSGRAGFVNGMGVEAQYAKGYEAPRIRDSYLPGQKLYGLYLATSGKNIQGALYDYLEAILALSGVQTRATLQIHAMWDDFFESYREGEFLHFCASKGTIMTSVALRTYPHPERIDRIRVIAVTPAVFIPESDKVMHFVSRQDVFPYLVSGLRESLFEENSHVTLVNAPGDEPNTAAHNPHAKAYQRVIKAYLRETPWRDDLPEYEVAH